jgi:tRNA(His) guanylyltransferase
MKFDDLDARMRRFETAVDPCVPPDVHAVARIDGRGFTRLTKELHDFEAPFDERFRDLMLATCEHLLLCGIPSAYAYTQSDEISLLLVPGADAFGRKLRKLNSILAGEASACFSLGLGSVACFDCRISQLPTAEDVVDYFRWRQADATRNALNAHGYWAQRRQGVSARAASAALAGLSVDEKRAFLLAHGVDFDAVPAWQRHGAGLYWETRGHVGKDPRTGSEAHSLRRQIRRDLELPVDAAYSAFVARFLDAASPEGAGD